MLGCLTKILFSEKKATWKIIWFLSFHSKDSGEHFGNLRCSEKKICLHTANQSTVRSQLLAVPYFPIRNIMQLSPNRLLYLLSYLAVLIFSMTSKLIFFQPVVSERQLSSFHQVTEKMYLTYFCIAPTNSSDVDICKIGNWFDDVFLNAK